MQPWVHGMRVDAVDVQHRYSGATLARRSEGRFRGRVPRWHRIVVEAGTGAAHGEGREMSLVVGGCHVVTYNTCTPLFLSSPRNEGPRIRKPKKKPRRVGRCRMRIHAAWRRVGRALVRTCQCLKCACCSSPLLICSAAPTMSRCGASLFGRQFLGAQLARRQPPTQGDVQGHSRGEWQWQC